VIPSMWPKGNHYQSYMNPQTFHPFFQLPVPKQRLFTFKVICFLLGYLLAVSSLIFVMYNFVHSAGLLLTLLLPLGFTLAAQFIDVPSMIKSGKLEYQSPMLLTETPRKGIMILHGATLFDYYFLLDRQQSGRERTRYVLKGYLEGLLKLLDQLETEGRTEIMLKGTSYFLQARTVERFGFRVSKRADGLQTLILLLNYAQLTVAHYLANGRLSFPDLRKVRTFEAKAEDLLVHRSRIRQFYDRL